MGIYMNTTPMCALGVSMKSDGNKQEKHEELRDRLSRYLFKRDFARITCIVEKKNDRP